MFHPYLTGPALLAACASGQGAIVIVEGEFYEEDAYFYGTWFGERAREISFFPQNGWLKVVSAVAELRQSLPHRVVFGIVDRDFASAELLQQQAALPPQNGVFRTIHLTVENYLLNPEGWLRVMRMLTRENPPAGWQTAAEIAARIDDAYRQCMSLAAFNYTVCQELERQPSAGIEYRRHPRALAQPEVDLLNWGQSRGTPVPLDQMYLQNCAMIQSLPTADWPIWITGKAVLKVFLENFRVIKSIDPELLKSLYIDKWPTPPTDLAALITRIVERRGAP